ncbi:hypothetical protein CAPTEDRAFT_212628 [Capitella teleta]|uniref:G-protein coupled receptors family 1 profile domain-containing protein n=1 Tax=Capitella teleta TaxID=283909 RepID=R7UUK7_CAPTE|nr:hypothetical protein CAPTEDRAFT_212628 [Capitella teleta]|eukprot:ELU07046.1 hypothetical protein CAPTEDRAFT_212628 [Capitella teleta]
MDTFLRLKDPQHRLQAPPAACSLLLWLAAPWAISAVQGVAQFMLSQGDHGKVVRHNGVCFIADKNFLVLGSLFAFFIPAIVSCAFGLLGAREIRALRAGKMLDDDINDESGEESTSCSETGGGAQGEQEEETVCTEQVQLDNVVAEPGKDEAAKESVTSFSGHTNLAFVEHLGSATDQSSSCTLLLRDGGVSTPVAEEDRCCPDEWLRHEYALSRLTICLLACCVAPWLPYALSNIVFAVCESCMASASQYSVLKWLAYCSAASAPLAQLRFSDGFRQTVCRILSCSCLRRKPSPPS